MSTARERFQTVLTEQYKYLFMTAEYSHAAKLTTPSALAEKITNGLIAGTADKDGLGIKNTCRALGIKQTYKAIRAFLIEAES